MADESQERPERYDVEGSRRTRVQQLFGYCEAWISGRLADDVFSRKTLELRRSLLDEAWPDRDDKLLREFNLAVETVLAIEQTTRDLRLLCQTSRPPLAARAYHFGARVSGEAILALETALHPGDPQPDSQRSSLGRDFDPDPN